MHKTLADLWALIGERGSRLNSDEKVEFVWAIAQLSRYSGDATLWTVMQWAYEDGELSHFPNTVPPLSCEEDNFEEVLSTVSLSKEDCWKAIAEISQAQALELSSPSVALVK